MLNSLDYFGNIRLRKCFYLWKMSFKIFLVLFMVSIRSATTYASNILLVPHLGEGSHFKLMATIAEELLHRGHNISILVSETFKPRLVRSNDSVIKSINFAFYSTDITLSDFNNFMTNLTNAGLKGKFVEYLYQISGMDIMKKRKLGCQYLLEDDKLLAKLQNSAFDISVVDNDFKCPIVQYLRQHMGIPFVTLSSVLTLISPFLLNNRIPVNPSYRPEMTSGLDHVMCFRERLINVATSLFFLTAFPTCAAFDLPFNELRNKHGISSSPCYQDAELFLVNTNFALDFAMPLLPNVIAVGGLTVRPKQPLQMVSVVDVKIKARKLKLSVAFINIIIQCRPSKHVKERVFW